MKELLRSFLPKNHSLSTLQDMGLNARQIFNLFLSANKFAVHFSYDCSGYNPMLNLATRYELEWNKLVLDLRPLPSDEGIIMRNLMKDFSSTGLTYQCRTELRSELKLESDKLRTFIEVLRLITTLCSALFHILRKANDTVSPYDLKRASSTQSDFNPPQAKKLKSEKTNVSSHPAPKALKPMCNGCGWFMRPKTEGANPTCCRGDDNAGCGNDPRHNASSSDWSGSVVGRKWLEAGYTSLPKDTTVTLLNAAKLKKERDALKASTPAGTYTCMLNHCNDLLLTNELIPFSLLNVQARSRVAQRKRTTGTSPSRPTRPLDEESARTPTLLLDTGALGSCVVSPSFLELLRVLAMFILSLVLYVMSLILLLITKQ